MSTSSSGELKVEDIKRELATFVEQGRLPFDSIVVVDSEGDRAHKMPHIYVDFEGDRGPFAGFWEHLRISEHHHEELDGLKRVEKFPKTFSPPKMGTIHDKAIRLNERARGLVKSGGRWLDTLYDCDRALDFLRPTDVVGIEGTEDREAKKTLIMITNKRQEKAKDILARRKEDPTAGHRIEEQIGRKLDAKDVVTIYEFKIVYDWQLEKK